MIHSPCFLVPLLFRQSEAARHADLDAACGNLQRHGTMSTRPPRPWEGPHMCAGSTRAGLPCCDREIGDLGWCLHHVPDDQLGSAELIRGGAEVPIARRLPSVRSGGRATPGLQGPRREHRQAALPLDRRPAGQAADRAAVRRDHGRVMSALKSPGRPDPVCGWPPLACADICVLHDTGSGGSLRRARHGSIGQNGISPFCAPLTPETDSAGLTARARPEARLQGRW